jgi:hypothetical protein
MFGFPKYHPTLVSNRKIELTILPHFIKKNNQEKERKKKKQGASTKIQVNK